MGQESKDMNISVQFMKLPGYRERRKILPVRNKAWSKYLKDMEEELGIFISHLLVMGWNSGPPGDYIHGQKMSVVSQHQCPDWPAFLKCSTI